MDLCWFFLIGVVFTDITKTDTHFAYDAELKSGEVVPASKCHNKNNKKYCEVMKNDIRESDSEELVKVVVEDYELVNKEN